MTYDELDAIIADVRCSVGGLAWAVEHGFMSDRGFWVRVMYFEADIVTGHACEQKGRRWYVSKFATKSEIVQTILKAALTSAEHMVREHFLYRGARIFGPHYNVDDLVDLVRKSEEDHRPAPEVATS